MKAQTSHPNTSSKQNLLDKNLNAIGFSLKHQIYPGFDKPENKGQPPNTLSHNKNPRKLSKLDILNNSHLHALNDDKRVSPMLFGYLKTEPQKDTVFSSGLKKSTRLNTGESDKHRRLETSFDSAYTDKQRLFNDPKKRGLPVSYNTRVYSHNRVVRNIPIKDYPVNKNLDDSSMESRRRRLYQNIQDKRPSAQMDTSLPAIYVNDERYKERSANNKTPSFINEVNQTQNADLQLLNKITKKEALLISNKISRIPNISNLRNENSKFLKTTKVRQENNLTPHLNKLTSNMKSTHSLTTKNNLSPEKSMRNESPDFNKGEAIKGDVNLLDALDPKKRVGNSVSIDYQFDKVNELTNKNNIARYDLLKIQESALELKMRLNTKRPVLQKNGMDMNATNPTNKTVMDDFKSYNSVFVGGHGI